jgi:hypothetical protein
MKYRTLVSSGGSHYPQFKSGFFSFWHHFSKHALDRLNRGIRREILIRTDDPQEYAVFGTMPEAEEFLTGIKEAVQKLDDEDNARWHRMINQHATGKPHAFK